MINVRNVTQKITNMSPTNLLIKNLSIPSSDLLFSTKVLYRNGNVQVEDYFLQCHMTYAFYSVLNLEIKM